MSPENSQVNLGFTLEPEGDLKTKKKKQEVVEDLR